MVRVNKLSTKLQKQTYTHTNGLKGSDATGKGIFVLMNRIAFSRLVDRKQTPLDIR